MRPAELGQSQTLTATSSAGGYSKLTCIRNRYRLLFVKQSGTRFGCRLSLDAMRILRYETAWLLPLREFLKRLLKLYHFDYRRLEQEHVLRPPLVVVLAFMLHSLEWILPQIEHFWSTQGYPWVDPGLRTVSALLLEHDFEIAIADSDDVTGI